MYLKLKNVLKRILMIIILIIAVLLALFVVGFIVTTIQHLIINDNDYLLLSGGNIFIYFFIPFEVVVVFIIQSHYYKRKNIYTSDKFTIFCTSKKLLIVTMILFFFVFVITLFNFDVAYNDKFTMYSITNSNGTQYEYSDIEFIEVKMSSGILVTLFGSSNPEYILHFNDGKKIEILSNATDFKNEEDTYDNNLLIDNKIKELEIEKRVNTQDLSSYLKTLDKKYADKIASLFVE